MNNTLTIGNTTGIDSNLIDVSKCITGITLVNTVTTGSCVSCVGYCNCLWNWYQVPSNGNEIKFNIKVDVNKIKEAIKKEIERQFRAGEIEIEI